ncbi:MAG: RNA polymerase factor sigma-54 [Sphingomonadaceae bacterium]
MALGPRLDLRTAQTVVLSPQLQAAIRLLALSNLELQAEIAAELERNPLLETAEDFEASEEVAEPSDAPVETAHDPAPMTETLSDGTRAEREDSLDADMVEERFHHDCAADSGTGAGTSEEGFLPDLLAAEEASLAEHLARQAGSHLSGMDLALALAIIGVIDEAGYLSEPLEEVALRLGVPIAEAERVLAIIQTFEPTGVGARSLAECIALQAREADRLDPCMQALIDHLDLVARGDLAQLRRLCHVDAEDLADMLRELRSYDPKPGLKVGGGRAAPVVPDLFVRRSGAGHVVELNSGTLPRLIVNRQYQAFVAAHAAGAGNKAEKQFLDGCLSSAQWLIRALDQRASTILKVASEIVKVQAGFFAHGVAHLKPMTLRQIAEATEVHESTVSRVTSNKYLSCERGVFELKYFFSSAVHSSDGGEDVAMEAVKARIRALIEAEPPMKPLSDNDLHTILEKEGFSLSRRTVAKYREAMHIPSSFDRKRQAVVRAA